MTDRLFVLRAAAVLAVVLATGCGSEPTDLTMTVASGEASRPTVAVSPDEGAVYWAWVGKDDDGWNTYVARLDDGATEPSAPVRVNHTPGNAAPHAQAPAQVVVRPDGGVVVAWTNRIDVPDRRFPASHLLVSVSEDGGRTFSPERPVHSDAGGPPTGHTFHDMAALADGSVVISWIDGRTRDAARRSGGDAPGEVVDTAANGVHGHHSAGGAMTPSHEPGSEIRVARSDDGGFSFTETAVVDTRSCPCCRTALAVSPDGRIYLAWRHEFDNGDRDIVLASSDDGGRTFSEPVRVHEDNWNIDACPHAGPSIAAPGDGRVDVVWYTGAGTGPGLYRIRSVDGGKTFGDRTAIVSDVPVRHASIDASGQNEVLLAYEAAASGRLSVTPGGQPDVSGHLPDVVAGGRTTVYAWQASDGVGGRVLRR